MVESVFWVYKSEFIFCISSTKHETHIQTQTYMQKDKSYNNHYFLQIFFKESAW